MLLTLTLAVGCGGEPTDDLAPVSNFDATKYLGTWYEIARLPNSFEDGLTNVTATYSPYKKDKIKVVNEGYNTKSGKWEQATGQAKFKGAKDQGLLKVTFVGGIYLFGGDYKIIELDPGYQYALVTSSTRDTLWFLSRTPAVSPSLLKKMSDLGRKLDFDVDSWILVDQSWN
jgi:apolipoprotein D and lipocalin family protein